MSQKDINSLVVTAANPCLLIYMLDRSASMSDKFGNADTSRAETLSTAINKVIYDVCLRCVSGSGELKSKFELALFAYGGNTVTSGWEGALAGEFVYPITRIFNNPLATDANEMPIWIRPHADGGTPMRAAFNNVKDLCEDWISWGNHYEICHPPIIINITDGEATDDDGSFSGIRNTVNQLRNMGTAYGSTIVMNIHISGRNYDRIIFPDRPLSNNKFESFLYDISSPLYPHMIETGRREGFNIPDNARGYIFNGDSSDLVRFINVGTNSGANAAMDR